MLNIEASRSAKALATNPQNSNSTLIVSASWANFHPTSCESQPLHPLFHGEINGVNTIFVSEGFKDGLIGGEMGELQGFGEVRGDLSHGSDLRDDEETNLFHQSFRQFHALLLNHLRAGHQGVD
nr:hypothetical protein CR513_56973 [Ipomoea batatas]